MDLSCVFNQFRANSRDKPCVLALESDEDNLLLIGYIIQQLNCDLLTATDEIQALSLAQEYQPDLILLEPDLPRGEGYKLIDSLKNSELTCTIPIIAVTRLVLPEEREALFKAGCNACLSKPYLIDALENLLTRYLHKISFTLKKFDRIQEQPFAQEKI